MASIIPTDMIPFTAICLVMFNILVPVKNVLDWTPIKTATMTMNRTIVTSGMPSKVLRNDFLCRFFVSTVISFFTISIPPV